MFRKFACLLVFFSCLLLFLSSCGPSLPELKLARASFDKGDQKAAHQYYSEVLKKDPHNREAKERLEILGEALVKELQEELEEELSVTKELTMPFLNDLLSRLEEVGKYDKSGNIFAAMHSQVKREMQNVNKKINKKANYARQALGVGKADVAMKYFEDIYKLDPQSSTLPPLEKEVMSLYSRKFEHTLIVYLKEGRINEIPEKIEHLREQGISEAQLENLSRIFDDFIISTMHEFLEKDLNKKRYYSAYLTILDSERKELFSGLLAKIRREGAAYYLSTAKKYQSRKQYHRAFLEAVKGLELDPEHPGLFEVHRDSQDQVLSGLQKYIAISAFGAPRKNPDLGPQFSDALISYLFRILPYGINIVERQKIDLAMEEKRHELGAISSLLNVDLIVTGNVSLMEIDRQEAIKTGVIRAKVGENQIVSPAYEEWEKRQKGDPPAAYLTVPVYDNVNYNKGRVKLKGFATVSARIFDARKGAITYAQEFNARYSAEDDFQDGVAGTIVEDDPLELPSETEIHEILRNQIIKQLADVIQAEFSKRKIEFVQEAQYFLARKEIAKAMKPLAEGFLYAVKSNLSYDDPDVRELRKMIVEHTEK